MKHKFINKKYKKLIKKLIKMEKYNESNEKLKLISKLIVHLPKDSPFDYYLKKALIATSILVNNIKKL